MTEQQIAALLALAPVALAVLGGVFVFRLWRRVLRIALADPISEGCPCACHLEDALPPMTQEEVDAYLRYDDTRPCGCDWKADCPHMETAR